MVRFFMEPLTQITAHIREWRNSALPGAVMAFDVVDPDLHRGCHSGEVVWFGHTSYIYRTLRCWLDLAGVLDCRLLTPTKPNNGFVTLSFEAIEVRRSWQEDEGSERYDAVSGFSSVHKMEEPYFLSDLVRAFRFLRLARESRVIDLGVNRGDELYALKEAYPQHFGSFHLTGVDLSESALTIAAKRFSNGLFIQGDIADFETWNSPKADVLVSIGTLHIPELNGKELFPRLVKTLLKDSGAVILGFPNVRYHDGELSFGARLKNQNLPDLSLLFKDIYFYQRWLRKKGYRLQLFGKYYLFLVADKPGAAFSK